MSKQNNINSYISPFNDINKEQLDDLREPKKIILYKILLITISSLSIIMKNNTNYSNN